MRCMVTTYLKVIYIRTLCHIPHQYTRLISSKQSIPGASIISNMSGDFFNGNSDRFKGVTVISKDEPCPEENFDAKLKASLEKWENEGVRGVWFYVQTADATWIPKLVQNGFNFHNANSDRVALIKWLPKDEPNQIPPYAHHMIGVGGMVVNDNDEVLAISEKYGVAPHWKLPGGYVDPGENLAEAVIREVKEETGIDTEFQSLIAIRHAHGYNFGCSDFYVIAHLKPLSHKISKCERELAECKWMPLVEYAEHPLVNNLNKFFAKKFMESRKKGLKIARTELTLRIKDFVRNQQVYSICTREEAEK